MAWNGSGSYSRVYGSTGWTDDRDAGTKITAARHDTHDEDLATAIDSCLTQNNESKPTATFAPNADASYSIGTSALRWVNLLLSGFVRIYNGATNYVTLQPTTLTATRTATFPDASGTVIFDTAPTFGPVGTSSGDGGRVDLYELAANGSHYFRIKAPDSLAANRTMILPSTMGSSGQFLQTNGSDTATWAAPASESVGRQIALGILSL